MKKGSARPATLCPRLRVLHGKNVALGPGKVELLKLVKETGSIIRAAERMDMSYMRAWTLIQTMNECFKEPLITTARGGESGGGAQLTATGSEALILYQQMEKASLTATKRPWEQLRRLLRK